MTEAHPMMTEEEAQEPKEIQEADIPQAEATPDT